MTRELLFQLIVNSISNGDVASVTSLVVEHNTLAKSFTVEELGVLSLAFKGSQLHNPEFYKFFVETNLYKTGTGASAFINELPFATDVEPHINRLFTPQHLQKSIKGYPDVIDVDKVTGMLQGVELKNHVGKQALKELKFGNRYDIITSKENFEFYQSQYENIRLRSNTSLKVLPRFLQENGIINSKDVITRNIVYFNQLKNLPTTVPRIIFK